MLHDHWSCHENGCASFHILHFLLAFLTYCIPHMMRNCFYLAGQFKILLFYFFMFLLQCLIFYYNVFTMFCRL